MQARTALIAAIICGTLAVGIVAADVAWSLEASIQAQVDGEWETVATTDPDGLYRSGMHPSFGCHGPEMRLVIENDRPFAAEVEVHVTYHNATSKRTDTLLRDTLDLPRFGEHTYTLTVPDAAFPQSRDNQTTPPERTIFLDVLVGDQMFGTAVCPEATS